MHTSNNTLSTEDEKPRMGKIAELFVYDQFNRVPVDSVEAGDICALTGIEQASIGETICDAKDPKPLPTIQVGACRCLAAVSDSVYEECY